MIRCNRHIIAPLHPQIRRVTNTPNIQNKLKKKKKDWQKAYLDFSYLHKAVVLTYMESNDGVTRRLSQRRADRVRTRRLELTIRDGGDLFSYADMFSDGVNREQRMTTGIHTKCSATRRISLGQWQSTWDWCGRDDKTT